MLYTEAYPESAISKSLRSKRCLPSNTHAPAKKRKLSSKLFVQYNACATLDALSLRADQTENSFKSEKAQ
jgi:hypothetical protein